MRGLLIAALVVVLAVGACETKTSGACEEGYGLIASRCFITANQDECEQNGALRGGRDPNRVFKLGATCESLGYHKDTSDGDWTKRDGQ